VRDDLRALVDKLGELSDWTDGEGRSAFDCPLEEATDDPEIRRLDAMSLGDYIESLGLRREVGKLFDPALKSAYGLGHDRVSAWAGADFAADEAFPADPGQGSLCFPGGNAFLADNLVRRLGPERLLPGAFVTEVREKEGEVRVGVVTGAKTRTLRARAVVFAAPQFMAPYLIPELPAEKKVAAKSLEYTPFVVANVMVSRTPPELAYSNQLYGDFGLSDFILADWAGLREPEAAPLSRPNALTAYWPLEAKERGYVLSGSSLADWEKKIVGDLERCLPGVGSTVTGFYLYRWGHAFAAPVKGSLFSPARQAAKRPSRRISFACADVEGIPTVDHAMAAGLRSAYEIGRLLG
ncbi:MAG: FAD-dependent oxidoreductase, partial [Spirochaetaceae bacterium]|nr:FAD-dependent oxidoreductase [Spirochaetaceae bacterium]